MKYILLTIGSIVLFAALSFAGNPAVSGENHSTVLPADVKIDPVTGNKIYINQLMLAFKEKVSKTDKDIFFKNNEIKIISSAPSLNIYHVSFINSNATLSTLDRVRKKLQKSSKVLYVYTCKLAMNTYPANQNLVNHTVERKGEIKAVIMRLRRIQCGPEGLQLPLRRPRF